MWVAPTLALAIAAGLAAAAVTALAIAAPLLLLWAASPALAWWVSRPRARRERGLSIDRTHFLHQLARKTWAYFELHVGAEDHWLPPDNVQEQPALTLAHRTSPTNMGLSLLANLSAHDFGYVSTGQLLLRTTHQSQADDQWEERRC